MCLFVGTGKTLIARKLAQCSGMDYAIMSGGDVGPLGEDAVNQLHGLFRWAATSQRGLLLFIDEAEAFLSARGTVNMATSDSDINSHRRHALNALLYQTGTQSSTFMLVLATNRPEDLDAAVLDRVDISLHVDLPARDERHALVDLYYRIHILNDSSAGSGDADLGSVERSSAKTNISVAIPEDRLVSVLENVTDRLDGFSGREISKLFVSVSYAAMTMTPQDRNLTESLLLNVVDQKTQEHRQKRDFKCLK